MENPMIFPAKKFNKSMNNLKEIFAEYRRFNKKLLKIYK